MAVIIRITGGTRSGAYPVLAVCHALLQQLYSYLAEKKGGAQNVLSPGPKDTRLMNSGAGV